MNNIMPVVISGLGCKKTAVRPARFGTASRQAVTGSFLWLMAAVVTSIIAGCATSPLGSSTSEADTDALFSRLEKLAPPTVMLQYLECRDGHIIVAGVSDKNAAVSRYMLNIANAGLDPRLQRIEPQGTHRTFVFLVRPSRKSGFSCSDRVRDYQSADNRVQR